MIKFSFKIKQGGMGNIVEYVDPSIIIYKDVIYDINSQTVEFYSYDNLMVKIMQKEIDKEILKEMLEVANQCAII